MGRTNSLPWWKKHPLVCAGGWHPLAARLRRGGQSESAEADYAWEYTEAHIRRLKKLGVNLLVGQFDRGLGETDQAPEQELARKQAALCRAHGIRHGCYLPNTIYVESVRKDHPECDDWVVKTFDGRFAHYGGEQTWRRIVCFNSPGWRARMKRQIRRAIAVVRTDLLHFDNLGVWPEPDSCHCTHCRRKFRAFLERRYPTAAAQKRRFGIAGFETFDPPHFTLRFHRPWDFDRIQDPLMQEWVDFRCRTVSDYIRDLSRFARKLQPGICIDCNGQSVRGENQALIHGTDQEAQTAWVDIVWEENPDYRADDEPGGIYPVTRKMRGLNYLRRRGKEALTAYEDAESLAFNLTFAGNPGINAHWGYAEPGRMPRRPHQEGVKELLDHHRRRSGLYAGATPAARIAVWRNRQSLAYVSTDTHLSACVMEHLLFTCRIPFSIVTDGTIRPGALRRFDLVIAPDVEYVTAEQQRVLTTFVKRGGGLLVTEQTGVFDGAGRRRRRRALAELFEAGPFARLGKGAAAYLPKIDYVHAPRAFASGYSVHYDGIDSRYWKRPHNSREVLDAIRWLCPTYEPVRVYGRPELRLDYLRLRDGALAAPMIRCGELAGPADVVFAVRSRRAPRRGRWYVPQRARPVSLRWERRDEYFETRLPALTRHGVVRYELGST